MAYRVGTIPLRHITAGDRCVLGEVVRQARLRARLSQAELAAQIGVKQNYISRLESGVRTNPSSRVLKALARVLNIPGDTLVQALPLPCDWDAELEAEVERRWQVQSEGGDFGPEDKRIITDIIRRRILGARARQAEQERNCAEQRPPHAAAG